MTSLPIRIRAVPPGSATLRFMSRVAVAALVVSATAAVGLGIGRLSIVRYDDPLVQSRAPRFWAHIETVSRNAGILGALSGYCLGVGGSALFRRITREENDTNVYATDQEIALIEAARAGDLETLVRTSVDLENA